MVERQLQSRSYSVARDVDGVRLESERDRAGINVDEEQNGLTDRRMESHDESSNNVVISVSQFHEFMSAVM
jgi:hypothetical protein